MATVPIGNADTKGRKEVRAGLNEEIAPARRTETEVDQIDFLLFLSAPAAFITRTKICAFSCADAGSHRSPRNLPVVQ